MTEDRRYLLERVDDVAVVQIYADGFSALPLREKQLAWHLYLAAIAGRDIYYDQRHALNLEIRELLETLLRHADRLEPPVLAELRRYTKLFWINTGPFNNLTARKFVLNLSRSALMRALQGASRGGATFAAPPQTLIDRLAPMLLDPAVDGVVTNKTPGAGRDILEASANNLYVGVRMPDVEHFAEKHGLNSRLVSRDGRLVEEVYKAGGVYDREIRAISGHLEDALPFAPPALAASLRALIRFYETGDDRDRVAYDIAWVRDQDSAVDTINGFVEVYLDPRGVKGAWEGIVYVVNDAKTRQIQTLAANAQWFEDHTPWEPRFRKLTVQGVTAKAIDVIIETGDSGPITAVGINLPNDQAIREEYGSKSVTLLNVNEAYEESTPEAMRTEFAWTPDEAERAKTWGARASELHTELHEVIGHGSGRMADGAGSPHLLLKEQYSAIEEARADLVALYFMPDRQLVEFGVVDAGDQDDLVRAAFEHYARNALVQLRRIRQGTTIEEDHMRNRQLIVAWLIANGGGIEVQSRAGKTYYVMTDPIAFRDGVGRLLADVQRIKSTGDYAGASALLERYGVHFDPALRDEVVARVDALDLPSYTAIVMPRLTPRYAGNEIVDIEISYPCDLETQMLEYQRSALFAKRFAGEGRRPMLSRRLPPHAEINALTRALARRRAAGAPVVDLTESNPTRTAFAYPPDLLRALASSSALQYEPRATGLRAAREAVARDQARRGAEVAPDQIVLTASTSEAYSWLFKLLCNPGDAVLVPRPSYPLFDHLTSLEGVQAAPFALEYHGRWAIDFASVEAAPANTRAVVLVSPNNPTGSFVTAHEVERITGLCRDRGWALIVDEVFADYQLDAAAPLTDIAVRLDVPAFTLGGLSKTVGLPQVKLGWIVVGGSPAQRAEMLGGLELIADSFLSVSTPVQQAAADLLERGATVRAQIHDRVRDNLATLRTVARGFAACDVLCVDGGWCAIVRVPATRSEEQFVLDLLEQEGVLVHPGYFFDFPREAFVVVSLLPPTDVFRDAVSRFLRFAER